MTNEEVLALADKVKNGTVTAEEELALLKFTNQGIEELRDYVKNLSVEEKTTEINDNLQ